MVLEAIYVVRHGYRSNWTTDPLTGTYTSTVRTPTGIPSDPALASYGVQQAEQLGDFLLTLDPPVDRIYSSPFYRCIQTLQPYLEKRTALATDSQPPTVHLDQGVGEFYGLARFDHPSPASLSTLRPLFPTLILSITPSGQTIVPSTKGESIPQLHDRVAYALHHLIRRADADPAGPKTLLICTHAAAIIAIGRALTGRMPSDEGEEDFRCFTCGVSKFVRKTSEQVGGEEEIGKWDPQTPEAVPDVGWRGGNGVCGGWTCEANSDCSFLENGEERGWTFDMEKQRITKLEEEQSQQQTNGTAKRFSGDESFLNNPNEFHDTLNSDSAQKGAGSRL